MSVGGARGSPSGHTRYPARGATNRPPTHHATRIQFCTSFNIVVHLHVSCQKQASKEANDLDGQLPFAGPGVHGSHALPSERIQPADHIPEVEGLVWGGEVHLHEVWVLQVPSAAAQVVHHRHRHTTLARAAMAPPRCPSLHCRSFLRRRHDSFSVLPFTGRSKQFTRLQAG